MMAEAGASARRNNNHNGKRRGEIGEQMNWTISLGAGAEGQALCKTEKERRTETEGEAERKSGEKIGNSGCQEEIVYRERDRKHLPSARFSQLLKFRKDSPSKH